MNGERTSDPSSMEAVAAGVEAILADADLEREGSEPSKAEAIERLYESCGWEPVRDYLMGLLEDPVRSVEDRMTVAAVFWGAVLDHLPVNADRLIALLYRRLPPDEGSSENNLAWSITSKLKGKSYLSRYDPLEDPCVRRELDRLDRP